MFFGNEAGVQAQISIMAGPRNVAAVCVCGYYNITLLANNKLRCRPPNLWTQFYGCHRENS